MERGLHGLTFTEEGAGGDDGEAQPETPDYTAKESDDLMAEEGREGDDEEDGDGDEPAGGEVVEAFGEGAEFLDDFVVLDGDVDGEDEDADADDVPCWVGC